MPNEKRVNTKYAADVFITNCGGSILWLETDGETAKIQEERNSIDGKAKFGRVYEREVMYNEDDPYITFRGAKYPTSQFYARH